MSRLATRAFASVLLSAALIIANSMPADARRAPRRHRAAPPAQTLVAPTPAGAQHITIMDGATGAILSCDDCTTPIPPASMSKLMTILIVAEAIQSRRLSENTLVTVSENAWRNGAMSDGSHMFLALNSRVRVGDLLRGAIIVSANDASIALAEAVAGSEEAFVARMNRRAREIGLTTAHFRNATGLPDPEHVISSADLARLARYLIVHHPNIYRLYSQREFTFNNRTQQNRNPLLGAFTGADGMKTGHTAASGYGLVGSAVLNGQRRIIVFNGTRTMAERRSEGLRLMRSAFYDYDIVRLAEANQPVGEAQVYLGGRSSVPLVSPRPIVLGMAHSARTGYSARIVYQGPIRAPIEAGQVIAHYVVTLPNGSTRRYPLSAQRRIGGANWFAQAWEGLARTIAPPRN